MVAEEIFGKFSKILILFLKYIFKVLIKLSGAVAEIRICGSVEHERNIFGSATLPVLIFEQ
jgi:hypothetical protein